jgi:hypothetical protein
MRSFPRFEKSGPEGLLGETAEAALAAGWPGNLEEAFPLFFFDMSMFY